MRSEKREIEQASEINYSEQDQQEDQLNSEELDFMIHQDQVDEDFRLLPMTPTQPCNAHINMVQGNNGDAGDHEHHAHEQHQSESHYPNSENDRIVSENSGRLGPVSASDQPGFMETNSQGFSRGSRRRDQRLYDRVDDSRSCITHHASPGKALSLMSEMQNFARDKHPLDETNNKRARFQ